MPPCYVLLVLVNAPFCALLLFIGVFLLCSIIAQWCFLPMFCWCLLMPPCYVLLVFIDTFRTVFCWCSLHLLAMLYWCSLVIPRYISLHINTSSTFLTLGVHWHFFVVFCCFSSMLPYYALLVFFGFLNWYCPLAFFLVGV